MTERRRKDVPFAATGKARPQADGDPDFAGDRSAAEEDVSQQRSPDNDGWSGVEDGATGDAIVRRESNRPAPRPPRRNS